MTEEQRMSLIKGVMALKKACYKSHEKGPGASRMCICGAGGGGSEACGGLGLIKNILVFGCAPLKGSEEEYNLLLAIL